MLGLLLVRYDFFCRRVEKMRKRNNCKKIVTWSIVIGLIALIGLAKLIITSNDTMAITKSYIYIEPLNSFFRKSHSNGSRDWNDYRHINADKNRRGNGEGGVPTYTNSHDPTPEERYKTEEYGHNVLVSDMISLDRSIHDFRSPECRGMHYRKKLPKVSIIIPFFDEHPTTIMRTVHSVINRSPSHLLKEIILVNDASTHKDLFRILSHHFIAQPWASKIKIFMMKERTGPNWSRLAGARAASGDVLLFLDCHVEVGYNFLPPLLDPIVENFRAVVTPTLDIIDKNTYEMRPLGVGRTVFDWNFHAQRIPFHEDHERSELFKTPITYGAAFAISAKFYWELQPDSGLKIYGGDQLEMSFKINLCGGVLYEAPCSRVAHLYRRFHYKKHQHPIDYKGRNNKRVAEIWLDQYKQYLYMRHPERYNALDIGDISRQLSLKASLKCKPFSYFFEKIAPEMLRRFPLEEFVHFASGTIRNRKINKCIQAVDKDHGGKVSLAECSHNKTNPTHQQFFTLRHFRDIMIHGKSDCLEGSSHGLNHARCHYEQGNQYFRYNLETNQIHWGRLRNNLCIDAHEDSEYVFINFCDKSKETQKWVWGFARMSALKNWINFGEPIIDKQEIKDLLRNPNDHVVVLPKNSSVVHGKPPKHGSDGTGGNDIKKHQRARQIKLETIPVKQLKPTDPIAPPVHHPQLAQHSAAKLPTMSKKEPHQQHEIPLKKVPLKGSEPINHQNPPQPHSDPRAEKPHLSPTVVPNATNHRETPQKAPENQDLPHQDLPPSHVANQQPAPLKHQPKATEQSASQKLKESRQTPSLNPTVVKDLHDQASQKFAAPPVNHQTAPQKPLEHHAPHMNPSQNHEPHKPVG